MSDRNREHDDEPETAGAGTGDLFEGFELPEGTRIWSVGQTPLEAIQALAAARWGGTVDELGAELAKGEGYDWGFRFWSDETAFKAAGINVPGGVLLTWWK